MRSDNPGLSIFEYQAPKVLNQAAPVQNTWYPIGLADGVMLNARAYLIGVGVEDTNETLECQILIDGEIILGVPIIANHSATYYVNKAVNAITRVDTTAGTVSAAGEIIRIGAFVIEGKSVEVQLRKTTAAGVGNLVGIVTWGQKKNN